VPSPRNTGRWILVLAVASSFTIAAAITVGRRTMRMASAMAAAADRNAFAKLSPGSTTQAVAEITSTNQKGDAQGKLLDRKREDLYRRTVTPVAIHYTNSTPFVMGKREDLHANAIVHVKGRVRADHSIAAEQIAILTGYVQVQ